MDKHQNITLDTIYTILNLSDDGSQYAEGIKSSINSSMINGTNRIEDICETIQQYEYLISEIPQSYMDAIAFACNIKDGEIIYNYSRYILNIHPEFSKIIKKNKTADESIINAWINELLCINVVVFDENDFKIKIHSIQDVNIHRKCILLYKNNIGQYFHISVSKINILSYKSSLIRQLLKDAELINCGTKLGKIKIAEENKEYYIKMYEIVKNLTF